VIASLDQKPRLAAAVSAAELELLNAHQAMKTLDETATVNTAAAQQKVAAARDAVRYAERYLNNLNSGSRGTDITKAEANVVLLKDRLDEAREDYAPYENKPEDNVTRATYLSRLADAERKYEDAVRLLNNLAGTPSDIDQAVAEANLSLAQAQLALAETEYEEVKGGPDPDDLQAAQARLSAAEAGLVAAQAALADAELKAPFGGTVVRLDLKQGEQAIPGQQAVVLADLSGWVVETEDLNEMEVPQVQVGQPASLIPEPIPDLELSGKVDSISQIYQELHGDITYKAKINLEETDPRLRWGMTVTVRFEP
jgi:multidrug resistance efflux pump